MNGEAAAAVASDGLAGAPAGAPRWGLSHRIGVRFAALYVGIFLAPWPLDVLPHTAWIDEQYAKLWTAILPWVGHHLLGIQREISMDGSGSGDNTAAWIGLLVNLAFAAAGALLWSILDRRRPSYPRLARWLRTAVRYYLAFTMFSYGIVKVLPSQFSTPGPFQLARTYGDSSPMGLLWTFMGFSTAYTIFSGAAEVAAALLLLWRRTAVAGALLAAAVMANIVMLNFAYDVPVKIYSSQLLAAALYVVWPDLRRVADAVLLGRAVGAADVTPLIAGRRRRRIVTGLFALVVAVGLGRLTWQAVDSYRTWGEARPIDALEGLYDVEEMERDGALLPPLLTDENRWRRVAVQWGGVWVEARTDKPTYFRYALHEEKGEIELTGPMERRGPQPPAPPPTATLALTRPDAERVELAGSLGGHLVRIRLHRRPPGLLMTRGFHWINEYPLNK